MKEFEMTDLGAACERVWLKRILKDMQEEQKGLIAIYCHNVSTIAMTRNSIFHSRRKHIDHFTWEIMCLLFLKNQGGARIISRKNKTF